MSTLKKALEITGAFEGPNGFSNLAGNFDGAGISFGVLQFNAKSGTLLRLMASCIAHMPGTTKKIFGAEKYQALTNAVKSGYKGFFNFCLGLNTSAKKVRKEWADCFIQLGKTPGCQKLQMKLAADYFSRAENMMKTYRFISERAFCLCFDIAVQNGSVVPEAQQFYDKFATNNLSEKAKLYLLAQAVTIGAMDRWEADVFSRKMCIVTGSGIVHGKSFNFDISDEKANLDWSVMNL